MKIRFKSIRHRITFGLITVIVVTISIFSYIYIGYKSKILEKKLHERLDNLVELSQKSLSSALWQYNYDFIENSIASQFLYEELVFTRVSIDNGIVIRKLRADFKAKDPEFFKQSRDFITREANVKHRKRVVGKIFLVLSRAHISKLIVTDSAFAIMLLFLIISAISLTTSLLLKKYLFLPLSSLENSARLIAGGKLDTRIDLVGEDEIGHLAQTFRQMMQNIRAITASRDDLNHEIKERKLVEEQIKSALKEKETLLQEIHHRVKNNMSVLSSLLELQMTNVADKQTIEVLQDSQNRLQTMSMIHETLYRSDNLSSIDMKTYLSDLGSVLLQSYTVSQNVNMKIDAEDVMIGVKQATPLGLIVNELITNALKYAFPDDRNGEIVLKLKSNRENQTEVIISDNGIGMPEGFSLQETDSLGLKLVKIITEGQLNGSVDMENKNGTKFIIKFNIDP